MSVIATTTEVLAIDAPLQTVNALPTMQVCDVPTGWSIEAVAGGPIAQRFKVPPSAFAFLGHDIDITLTIIPGVIGNVVVGAVYPESNYLEPTIGQIWPRIG